MERERQRNQKEISALEHTNSTLTRQRDDTQRVVLHLRSLINGQSHHMEHIVRSIGNTPEISEYVEESYEDAPEETTAGENTETVSVKTASKQPRGKNEQSDEVTPDKESQRLSAGKQSKRVSQLSMSDVADRHLRDKTDAIADIIRNISDQCAAAVEGLNLAMDADEEEAAENSSKENDNLAPSDDGRAQSVRSDGSDTGGDDSLLSPDNCNSSLPPTPDLIHNRSSTSMSMASSSTVPERSSQQYSPGELPTKIVEDDDEYAHETETIDDRNSGKMSKQPSQDIMRPNTTRIVM